MVVLQQPNPNPNPLYMFNTIEYASVRRSNFDLFCTSTTLPPLAYFELGTSARVLRHLYFDLFQIWILIGRSTVLVEVKMSK